MTGLELRSIYDGMKLIATVKLNPTPAQATLLRATLERCNAACSWLAAHGFATETFRQYDLHKLAYHDIKARFGLGAQPTVRCIAKVAHAYQVSRKVAPTFRKHAAQPYDARIFRFVQDNAALSIWTLEGRITLPVTMGEHQRRLMAYRKGEADLTLIRRKWYLICTCEVPETEPFEPDDWLGVDFGIVNLAVDSDGRTHSGATVEAVRRRFANRRKNLQRKGTRAARRKLHRISGRQGRFQAIENHVISKAIVAKAERSRRGIALEDLLGIRGRVKARRRQRARLANWAFAQLRSFVSYKARRVGVPVLLVDPRNTSRECPSCGHVDKANRRDRDTFVCRSCGLAGLADAIAAVNIRSRARAVCKPAGGACPELTSVAHVA